MSQILSRLWTAPTDAAENTPHSTFLNRVLLIGGEKGKGERVKERERKNFRHPAQSKHF
ncbi:hypothetical protein COO91_07867 [Nostoc flagelliforme CCNUN1]|uniref:Uncharacterized protein n=1 Tax=Nostoc flagelliforme CCNUN1 TaxID=2038116 RepID=A0A2K8T267_9NOSO|nr:hypothetical protein COO91_07867 [Nostoc flagelliforme CCNUN1]